MEYYAVHRSGVCVLFEFNLEFLLHLLVRILHYIDLGVESLEPLQFACQLDLCYLVLPVSLPLLVVVDLELLLH